MRKIVTLLVIFLGLTKVEGQWISPGHLPDLNGWTSTGGLFEWYDHTNNTPNGQRYGNGLQLLLGSDPRHGAQIAIPTFDQNIYFRRYAGGWSSWDKVWHSGNMNRGDVDFNAKNLSMGDYSDNSYAKLLIKGPNIPGNLNSKRDISFEFAAAGKAQIRSYRGGSWDTYLQFLTSSGSNTGGEPSVRLHINSDGYVGIGTTNPQKLNGINRMAQVYPMIMLILQQIVFL